MLNRCALLLGAAAMLATSLVGLEPARAETVDPRPGASDAPVSNPRAGSVSSGRALASKSGRRARRTAAAKRRLRKRRASGFTGFAPSPGSLRRTPAPRPAGELRIYSVNLRETLELSGIYDDEGRVAPEAVEAVSRLLRDPSGRVKRIKPRLVEILASVYERFGKRRLILISGFRSPRGTQNYHTRGAAADIKIEGVSARRLRDYVRSLDTGGMGIGIYPKSGFVHVDVRPPPSYYWTDVGSPPARRRPAVRRSRPRYEEAGAQ